MYQYIITEVENRIGYVTLNRPDKRNALSGDLVQELKDALRQLESDASCKVIVLRANGAVFSAGADLAYLTQLQNNTYEENYVDSSSLAQLFSIIYHHKKVIIAQVEGAAIAGGCGLATVADFTFSTPEVMMGYTEVKIGFIPAIVSIFLLRKIGEGRAKDLLLTGRLITATEAMNMGLINQVIEKEKIALQVKEFASQLCTETSAQSLALTKSLIAEVQHLSIAEGLDYAARQNAHCRAEEDCKLGIAAFLHKEKIQW